MDGSIGSTYIHDRALKQDEIQQLYADPLAPFRLKNRYITIAGDAAPAGGLDIPVAMHHYKQLMGAN